MSRHLDAFLDQGRGVFNSQVAVIIYLGKCKIIQGVNAARLRIRFRIRLPVWFFAVLCGSLRFWGNYPINENDLTEAVSSSGDVRTGDETRTRTAYAAGGF